MMSPFVFRMICVLSAAINNAPIRPAVEWIVTYGHSIAVMDCIEINSVLIINPLDNKFRHGWMDQEQSPGYPEVQENPQRTTVPRPRGHSSPPPPEH
ncbi:unnamed protein product [Nezara viridula]|uniref:Neuropeptide n=1 Tax=Nezara viridula TaxID=85310 RepID=A0A9P0E447_NEZVI|nr:unnamed protein product [Nezara viridula]